MGNFGSYPKIPTIITHMNPNGEINELPNVIQEVCGYGENWTQICWVLVQCLSSSYKNKNSEFGNYFYISGFQLNGGENSICPGLLFHVFKKLQGGKLKRETPIPVQAHVLNPSHRELNKLFGKSAVAGCCGYLYIVIAGYDCSLRRQTQDSFNPTPVRLW